MKFKKFLKKCLKWLLVLFLLFSWGYLDGYWHEYRSEKVVIRPEKPTFSYYAQGVMHKYPLYRYAQKTEFSKYRFWMEDDNRMHYIGDDVSYDYGIDVSSWQGKIDWDKVAQTDIRFVFIRLGYRGYLKPNMVVDNWFAYNLKEAKRVGLDVGVYFYTQAINEEEAMEEAKFCIRALNGVKLELPIAYDAERMNNPDARGDQIYGVQVDRNAKAFVRTCEENGYEATIYTNTSYEGDCYEMIDWDDYRIWFAGYDKYPVTPYHYSFWQYSVLGEIDGIEGNVDMNMRIWKNK